MFLMMIYTLIVFASNKINLEWDRPRQADKYRLCYGEYRKLGLIESGLQGRPRISQIDRFRIALKKYCTINPDCTKQFDVVFFILSLKEFTAKPFY